MPTFLLPTDKILRRRHSSWLAVAAAAISNGKSVPVAIDIADEFEAQLYADLNGCAVIEDRPPAPGFGAPEVTQ